jgi:hypothetical protein
LHTRPMVNHALQTNVGTARTVLETVLD